MLLFISFFIAFHFTSDTPFFQYSFYLFFYSFCIIFLIFAFLFIFICPFTKWFRFFLLIYSSILFFFIIILFFLLIWYKHFQHHHLNNVRKIFKLYSILYYLGNRNIQRLGKWLPRELTERNIS